MNLKKPLVAGILLSTMAIGPALAQKAAPATKKGATSASASASSAAAPAASTEATAAAPASGSGPSTAPPPVPTTVDGQTYAVRLRDLEQRVDELKEQIRRSHTRLSLLSDSVLASGSQGARAEITYQNDMSSAFRLVKALFVLDGAVQYNKADESGTLADQSSIPIFTGSIPPGDHTIQVLVQFQGNGYGVFSYLRGYKFDVRASHSFTVTEGKTISLQVVSYEKGGPTTPLDQRPSLTFRDHLASGVAGAPAPASSGGSPAAVSTGFSIGGGK